MKNQIIISEDCIDILHKLLEPDVQKRATIDLLLNH